MPIKSIITQAGKYPVHQEPRPHNNVPVKLGAPRCGVLHTTEGGWDGSDGVFKHHFAPHFLLGKYHDGTPRIQQMIPIGLEGLSTRAHDNQAIVQIEMIGYASETPWVPDDITLDLLASLLLVCRSEWGIPLSHPWQDGDYGRAGHNPHRRSGYFGHIAGWYGHADMPDPDVHWDPGNLQWSKVFERCHSLETPPVPAHIQTPALVAGLTATPNTLLTPRD